MEVQEKDAWEVGNFLTTHDAVKVVANCSVYAYAEHHIWQVSTVL